jgi:hypothetical protein
MYISRNDGMLNKSVLVQRDTLINANTIIGLSKKYYTEEDNKLFELLESELGV